MTKHAIRITLCAMFFVLSFSASAQQSAKLPRVVYFAGAIITQERTDAFRRGLTEHGYVEGKNIIVEFCSTNGRRNQLPEVAAELVRSKVNVIVTGGDGATQPLKERTSTIPIVMAQDTDPVGSGFIVSLARPGGNITGLATLAPEIGGKQIEVLKEIVPRLSRVGIIGNSTNPGDALSLRETVIAAGSIDVYLRYLYVPASTDFERVFQIATKGRIDGVMVLGNPVLNSRRKLIVDLAAKYRLPATYTRPEFIEAGGLMYYSTNYNDLFHRAANYVDKILTGAKPADLPVEQPKKFEFVVNLKAARQIGLTIPPNVLARADRVIK